jgi:hypothetical protein
MVWRRAGSFRRFYRNMILRFADGSCTKPLSLVSSWPLACDMELTKRLDRRGLRGICSPSTPRRIERSASKTSRRCSFSSSRRRFLFSSSTRCTCDCSCRMISYSRPSRSNMLCINAIVAPARWVFDSGGMAATNDSTATLVHPNSRTKGQRNEYRYSGVYGYVLCTGICGYTTNTTVAIEAIKR